MDVLVEMAIDLACQLQEDARCQAIFAAQKAADADEGLQKLIGEFNLKRIAINNEESKEADEQSPDRLRELNGELRALYGDIMANERMIAYNDAKMALDELVRKIQTAINLAVQGQDPHMAAQDISCSGDCGSCGGCH
ncbi:MAG: YlbF family regulator [Clostridia bacterium]|nr:YlbF family regulator [Clostridia bacterium]